jgi:hypothetical protein
MSRSRFEEMKSIDANIKRAMLAENGGRPPDNFIEDAQGGGLEAELIANESPTEEQELVSALDRELLRLNPDAVDVLEGGTLRND